MGERWRSFLTREREKRGETKHYLMPCFHCENTARTFRAPQRHAYLARPSVCLSFVAPYPPRYLLPFPAYLFVRQLFEGFRFPCNQRGIERQTDRQRQAKRERERERERGRESGCASFDEELQTRGWGVGVNCWLVSQCCVRSRSLTA